jgi:ferritin-like metal-binding protein YciE
MAGPNAYRKASQPTRKGLMPDITTPRELFLHELGDILYVEQKLTQEVLPKLIQEVGDPAFKKGLERHLEQTREHITNLEQIFDSMGEEPKAEKCIGFEGLKKEHDELASEVSESLIDMVDTGAAVRTEHYEIAAYNGLIEMARALGESEAVALLEENLKQEREALHEVESVAKKLRDETKATAS